MAVVRPVGPSADSSRKTTAGPPSAFSRYVTTAPTSAHLRLSTPNGPTIPAQAPSWVTTTVTIRPIALVWLPAREIPTE